MPEIVTLEDGVDAGYFRRVHLMSSAPVVFDAPRHGLVEMGEEAGMHWLKASWLWRAPAIFSVAPNGVENWCVLWGVERGERVSIEALKAAFEFERVFGRKPEFCFVRQLPAGVDFGEQIKGDGFDLALFDSDVVPSGFLAVR